MQILTHFQLQEFLHFWLRYTTLSGNILRVLWRTTQRLLELVLEWWRRGWEARNCFHERTPYRNQGRFAGSRLANGRNKSFHCDDSSSLTTLCGDLITCNVYRAMTSWRERLPRFSLDARSRKKHSGSFYVLNYWPSKPCSCCCGTQGTHAETWEPEGDLPEPWISPMD